MQLFSIQYIFVHFICSICYFICLWHCDIVCFNTCSCYLCWCIHICNDCCWTCIAIPNKVSTGEPFFWHCHSPHQICWDFDRCLCVFALFVASLQLFYVSCSGWCFLNDCWFGLVILRICSSCKPWPTNWINNKNICPWWWCDLILILLYWKLDVQLLHLWNLYFAIKTCTWLNCCIFAYIQSNYFWIN